MSGEPLVQIVVTKADNKPTKPGKQAKPNSSATKGMFSIIDMVVVAVM